MSEAVTAGGMEAFTVALLDGAFETPLWSGFLRLLRESTAADYAVLVFQPPAWRFDDALHLISGDASADDIGPLYRRYFRSAIPMIPERLVEGRPYALEELVQLDGGVHAHFYADLMQDKGVSAARQIRIREPSGFDAWLTIARRGADFGEGEEALLRSIGPVLRGVLRHYIARERDRFAGSMASDAVGRLQLGWIALDRAGVVVDCDAFGERVLGDSGVIRVNGRGRLVISPAEREREILQAIGRMADDPQGRSRAFTLSADPWLDMLLAPARRWSLSVKAAPSVIAYVHRDNWRSTDRCGQLVDLFALSQKEAQLVLALCRGRSIAEAAVELGLTLHTARSYSKLIYAKTGTRGVADLVRLVMGSVLALAPDSMADPDLP